MAARSASPRQAKAESPVTATFWWGFVLLAIALVVLLSLVSYSAEDSEYLQELYPRDSGRIAFNWMGKPGAVIAYGLGTLLFGRWAAFGVAAVIGIWGWTLLRHLHWKRPLILSAFFLGMAVWLSAMLGLIGKIGGLDDKAVFHHEGLFGSEAAGTLVGFLNAPGAMLIMAVTLILGLAATVAGFAGWFENRVNTAIDRAAQVKLPPLPMPKTNWLKRLFVRKAKPVIQPDDDDEEAVAIPMVAAATSGGDGARAPIEIVKPARREKASDVSQLAMQIEDRSGYVFPSIDLFNPAKPGQDTGITSEELQRASELLEKTLATFGVQAKVVRVNPGPVITRFDLEPAAGVKVSKIEALADDIALALRARGLRILAPIPGMAAVGVEIANPKAALVTFREVVESSNYQNSSSKLQIALGRTVEGDIFCTDLGSLPHLLIAGTTGSGKSVCVNTIIASILLRTTPEEVQFVMIDPKKLELAAYNELRNHHVTHRPDLSEYVITKPDEAVKVLRSCLIEMEHRYDLLAERGARHIREYNEMVREKPGDNDERELPYIVVVIDELADLMVTAQREVEEPIARLAQLARAVGIHLIVATQRPSVDVITGVIKANFPARIAFRVAMKVDSRTILDTNGAEMLLGQGDMLFQHPEEPAPIRVQGALLTSSEISRLITHICKQRPPRTKLVLPVEPDEENEGGSSSLDPSEKDQFFMEAAKIVVRTGQGSVSILQRRLKIGYSRAARLIDQLERAGIVGPFDGSKARAVLVDEHYFDTPMKRKLLLLASILMASALYAATGEQLAATLERHLQSLKSLEIRYQAVGSAGEQAVEGRMILVQPDRFYHDTPEWTVCRMDDDQWRYLKIQKTLIRETASEDYTVSPQSVLFSLQKNFRVISLETLAEGRRELKMEPSNRDVPGALSLEFPAGKDTPDALVFSQGDGGTLRYDITRWDENVKPDPTLFTPPNVAPENVIDFRGAGKGQ